MGTLVDGTYRHEYVVFSDTLRKRDIPQYLDNREVYGHITFATTRESFVVEAVPNAHPEHATPETGVFGNLYGVL